ncbi:ABC transporter permease [Allokutzneria sp. A3M-2-11 16]|uniref:sugar ABC transporter permease n=1 Tax=Allokutzneria sp. A3M-2-11 16 TaxID=2962043 RepID=UPI0020B81E8B|nr:ABC transporter permease [Allokutzneria sp. A3M-2-11 16]MCP3797636.1 ABC transporter permease [Allokutzneria sp. A3M-2-11 16]
MTETPAGTRAAAPGSTAQGSAAQGSTAVADFGIDTAQRGVRQAIGDYFARLSGGQLGALPALGGLVVLFTVFTVLSPQFLTLGNIANLLTQGAGITVIGMGLVYVLLLGEIDLSAGTASGVTAAVWALHLKVDGNLLGGMGSWVFYLTLVAMALSAGMAVLTKLHVAAIPPVLALVLMLIGLPANPWLEMLLALCIGTAIGCLTGFLVAKVGIPSFVVTLALFLAWQGVVLLYIGEGGTLAVNDEVLFNVANGNLSPLGSWLLFVLAGAGYAAVVLGRHFGRLKRGLVVQPTALVGTKVGVIVVLGAVATYALNLNRSPNEAVVIQGVPYVVPIVLGLLVLGTFVLDRTRYGRHVYAVGGNAEAARRAGIDVTKVRMSVFVICSTVAAIGAIILSSKVGSVDPQAGGGNTLLFAVGAAVIGGTSLFGGKGRVRDAIVGGAVIATIENGLRLLGEPAAVVSIVTGLVLLLAASVDALSRRRSAAAGVR